MPGGTRDAYQHIEPIVKAVAAQVHFTLPAAGMHTVSAKAHIFSAAMCTGRCIRHDELWPVSACVTQCASTKSRPVKHDWFMLQLNNSPYVTDMGMRAAGKFVMMLQSFSHHVLLRLVV